MSQHTSEQNILIHNKLETDNNSNKNTTFNIQFTSYEVYDLKKLKALYYFLEDNYINKKTDMISEPTPSDLTDSEREDSIHKRALLLHKLLNIIEPNSLKVCGQHVCRATSYGLTSTHKYGRLYAMYASILFMPKEMRYYLISELYKDIDLANAHPSILMEFAERSGLYCPTLTELVEQRKSVYLRVTQEDPNISYENAKIVVLSCLNRIIHDYTSQTLISLHNEIMQIREHLWELVYMKDADLQSSLSEDETFSNYSLKKKKRKIQTLYCFSNETKLLLGLKQFLENKTQFKESTWSDDSKQTVTSFSFVPIFDGAVVRFEDVVHQMRLETYVDEFNNTLPSRFNFKVKTMEPHWDLLHPDILKKYEVLVRFLSSITHKEYRQITSKLGIAPFQFTDSVLAEMKADAKKNEDGPKHNTTTSYDNDNSDVQKPQKKKKKKTKLSGQLQLCDVDKYSFFVRQYESILRKKLLPHAESIESLHNAFLKNKEKNMEHVPCLPAQP